MTGPLPEPPRFEPQRSLPPYRYRPGGQAPHPWRHPGGYAYEGGRPPDPPAHAPWSPGWMRELRYGADLFNRGYLWEAHEVWEGLWKGLPRGSPAGLALQGLILAAAALLKDEAGLEAPRERLRATARQRLLEAERRHRHGGGPRVLSDPRGFLEALDARLGDPARPLPFLRPGCLQEPPSP